VRPGAEEAGGIETAGPRPSGLDTLVDATPTGRDRMVDFLRVASIVAVVFGHWFIGVIWRRGGKIGTVSAIGLTGWLWIATWFLQVIPLFFFVGGFSNLVSFRSYRRRGRSVGAFLSSRAERLLRPTAVFLGVWLVIEVALHLLDAGGPAGCGG
jgi:fucose 4-O-acetylase-like acetyltransferase